MSLPLSLSTLIKRFSSGDSLEGAILVYHQELLKWNQRINLVSRKETDLYHHFEDSLHFAITLPLGAQVVDVGSGGGFPGLVSQIARPDCHFTLFEPTQKKVAFLQHIAVRLAPTATIRCERVEGPPGPEFFGHAVCKAFTDLHSWETLMTGRAKELWFLASQPQMESMGSLWHVHSEWHHETHGRRYLLHKTCN
ncbi:class I SAM-dependent methyltransferase [Myxococcota bacterium]|nr:class I SAM-dependent methyltransferase [Myxococcota bacterium]MBU1533724.1 class I SAM-dependent methyltransferase [Myxococcota bacterium]